ITVQSLMATTLT
nr:immunoglobulin heavy chain junction region [Mus musculus]